VTQAATRLYFPLIDHTLDYSLTAMMRSEERVTKAGISPPRVELWGERCRGFGSRCDDDATGVPATERQATPSARPAHVGLRTRHVVGAAPAPEDWPIIGCEATVYAWGWQMPNQAHNTGQDYQAWFRNGMLRFSQWLNLGDQTSRIPAPDDDAWWDARCAQAWSGITNWVYSGKYKIGQEAVTDTLTLPLVVTAEVPTAGASLTSTLDNIVYTFPADTFTEPAVVTHTIRFQSDCPSTGQLQPVDRFFKASARWRIRVSACRRGLPLRSNTPIWLRDQCKRAPSPYISGMAAHGSENRPASCCQMQIPWSPDPLTCRCGPCWAMQTVCSCLRYAGTLSSIARCHGSNTPGRAMRAVWLAHSTRTSEVRTICE
jgi:hypothetical protein